MQAGTAVRSDLDALAELNRDYIASVQNSDVQRFDEILANDFMCSNPDGSLIDRAAFLEQTAKPVTISNLEARDVNIRLMGDFAIIHARTTYSTTDGEQRSGRYTAEPHAASESGSASRPTSPAEGQARAATGAPVAIGAGK